MDRKILVESGRSLLQALDNKGILIRAAVWVHNTDIDSWRLWLVPPKDLKDKAEFYRVIVETIADESNKITGIDASDTEMLSAENPAIVGLRQMYHVTGNSSAHISNSIFGDYYLPDGIILRLDT